VDIAPIVACEVAIPAARGRGTPTFARARSRASEHREVRRSARSAHDPTNAMRATNGGSESVRFRRLAFTRLRSACAISSAVVLDA
jgi:hypothetical protein